MPAIFRETDKGIELFVRVTPGAVRNEFNGPKEGADGKRYLSVRVTAPPDKGKANSAIIKLVADAFGVAKSSVSIVNGETARVKTLAVNGDPEELARAAAQLEQV